MTFNEFAIEAIVEHILHCDFLDFLHDLGEDIADGDIGILNNVDGAIKRNNLEIFY